MRITTAAGEEIIEDVSVPLPEAGRTIVVDETHPRGFKWVDAASVIGAIKNARIICQTFLRSVGLFASEA